mgnify:CR=1 FL=1
MGDWASTGQPKELRSKGLKGRVSRTTGSGWDPYTRFLMVPILKVVRNVEILCALKLFDEWYD